jgi:hypothetical protein
MYSYVLIAFFFLHLDLSFSPFFQTCFSFSAFILSSFSWRLQSGWRGVSGRRCRLHCSCP